MRLLPFIGARPRVIVGFPPAIAAGAVPTNLTGASSGGAVSNRHLNHVLYHFPRPRPKGTARDVLVILADKADKDGANIFPLRTETLADWVDAHPRTVRSVLQDLRMRSWLTSYTDDAGRERWRISLPVENLLKKCGNLLEADLYGRAAAVQITLSCDPSPKIDAQLGLVFSSDPPFDPPRSPHNEVLRERSDPPSVENTEAACLAALERVRMLKATLDTVPAGERRRRR